MTLPTGALHSIFLSKEKEQQMWLGLSLKTYEKLSTYIFTYTYKYTHTYVGIDIMDYIGSSEYILFGMCDFCFPLVFKLI